MLAFWDLLHDMGFFQTPDGRVGSPMRDVQEFLGLGRGDEGIEEEAFRQIDRVGRGFGLRQTLTPGLAQVLQASGARDSITGLIGDTVEEEDHPR